MVRKVMFQIFSKGCVLEWGKKIRVKEMIGGKISLLSF